MSQVEMQIHAISGVSYSQELKRKKKSAKGEKKVEASSIQPGKPVEMISLVSEDEEAYQELINGGGAEIAY